MPPPVRSAEREGRPNHCERRRRARMPIPSADGSAGTVRIFYCIQGGTAHNVRDNDVCVRCENKRGEPPNCYGRKCYERGCCRQRRRGRKHHARMPIPSADGSAGTVRIFYCIQGGTAHNVRDNDVCVRCENKRGEPPNCCGRKCYERVCCRQRRRGRKHHARTPIPPADGSAGAVRIFYCIQGGTEHNVRDNDVCVRCENKRGEPPNCCGRKCCERRCCGQRRCGRRRRARTPIPSAEDSADAVCIFYCIRVETAHNVRSDGSCARREKKKGRGVSPLVQVLGTLIQKLSCAPAVSHPKWAGHNWD